MSKKRINILALFANGALDFRCESFFIFKGDVIRATKSARRVLKKSNKNMRYEKRT